MKNIKTRVIPLLIRVLSLFQGITPHTPDILLLCMKLLPEPATMLPTSTFTHLPVQAL